MSQVKLESMSCLWQKRYCRNLFVFVCLCQNKVFWAFYDDITIRKCIIIISCFFPPCSYRFRCPWPFLGVQAMLLGKMKVMYFTGEIFHGWLQTLYDCKYCVHRHGHIHSVLSALVRIQRIWLWRISRIFLGSWNSIFGILNANQLSIQLFALLFLCASRVAHHGWLCCIHSK